MGTIRQDLSGMMQVYSLATWEVKKDKPSSGWFMYQNQNWHSVEDEDEADRSKGPGPGSNASTPDSPSASPLGVSLPPDVQAETSPTVLSRYKSWRNPNPSNHANYADPSRNIFLSLQKQVLTNLTETPLMEITFPNLLPPPDDQESRPIDSKYLTFFLTEVPSILGSDRFFPTVLNLIFQRSVNQPVLRHSILALSSWIIDNRQGKPPLYTHHHLHKVLPVIQNSITEMKIHSVHILSVSFLSWLALLMGDLHATHRHLKGLFQMLIQTHHLSSIGEPYENSDPVIMFLYRMSLQIDNTLGYRNFTLAFPPITDHEVYHRQWIPQIISSKDDIDTCIATLKVDDLTNQICHLHHDFRQHRKDGKPPDPALLKRAEQLQGEHTAWLKLPVIQDCLSTFSSASSSPEPGEDTFLHYPPFEIVDLVFAQMRLLHASLGIHLSFAKSRTLGPYPHSRYENAVEICRIYTATGMDPAIQQTGQSRVMNGLWLAGLVLGSPFYPAAFQWILERLEQIDRHKGYRAASRLADSLKEIWFAGGDAEPWEIVGRLFEGNWYQGRPETIAREEIVNDTEWRGAIVPEEYS